MPHGKLAMTCCRFPGRIKRKLFYLLVRDLPEIRRGGRGRGGFGILNLGSEMRLPTPVMGVKFANHPLELLKEKCSRLFKVPYSKPTSKKRKQKQNKRKAKKASNENGS